jgi:tubulin--tyrosine ligase-like protein 12
LFPALEIINSKFTSKAGEWSLLFYARDQKVDKVCDIRELDLSGKGLLYVKDISIFSQLTSLHELDISDHPEFLQSDGNIKAEEQKLKEGSPEQQSIEFQPRLHSIDELLLSLPKNLRILICDEDLEAYILTLRAAHPEVLPGLRTLNDVSVTVTEEREKERQVRKVTRELWKYAGTYRIVSESQMDEENIWYINDEIGSLIKHSDQPNFAMHPFIYAPSNKLEDPHTITYSVCWPVKNIAEGDVIYRDFLKGYDEEKFRSTRFSVWFDTPKEYFEEQLKIYRSLKPAENALSVH